MKIRNGFVSNSSSSSFVIDPLNISEKTLKLITEKQDWIINRYFNKGYLHFPDSMENEFLIGELLDFGVSIFDIKWFEHSNGGTIWDYVDLDRVSPSIKYGESYFNTDNFLVSRENKVEFKKYLPPYKKIGLFCGHFNPIHFGHLIAAQEALEQADLDVVFFMISKYKMIKDEKDNWTLKKYRSGDQRFLCTQVAIIGNQKFRASRREIEKDGGVKTIHIVNDLIKDYPESEIYLIMGSDHLSKWDTWYKSDELRSKVRLVIIPRVGFDNDESNWYCTISAKWLDMNPLSFSSTQIREKIIEGKSIKYLVPEDVRNYLKYSSLEYMYRQGKY